MSQIFLELQPKTKNCLLEEYNQKALARIAMSCYNLLANLVITAKNTQCDGRKYQKALDRIAVATFD
jgi:hypothetical protein